MGRLISLAELAVRTGMCESTWRKKVSRGEVPVIRIGRSVRVDEEIVKLIVQCGVRSKPSTAPVLNHQSINTTGASPR
jgi:excisionase family DNA binding protein